MPILLQLDPKVSDLNALIIGAREGFCVKLLLVVHILLRINRKSSSVTQRDMNGTGKCLSQVGSSSWVTARGGEHSEYVRESLARGGIMLEGREKEVEKIQKGR